jgi:hypothetical protein
MLLATPALDPLRLASPNDILRIGIVAACGFRYSPVFTWERPWYAAYPADTLLSHRQEFSDIIKTPEYIVLVAVDKYDPDEGKKSEAVIPPDNEAETPAPGQEVIVGVACWKLQPGSSRVGRFQNGEVRMPRARFNHPSRSSACFSQAPTYSYPELQSRLKSGSCEAMALDCSGVIAAKMGEDLHNRPGYTHLEDLRLDGDEQTPRASRVQ